MDMDAADIIEGYEYYLNARHGAPVVCRVESVNTTAQTVTIIPYDDVTRHNFTAGDKVTVDASAILHTI